MTDSARCLICSGLHEFSVEARQLAYKAIYRIQIERGDKLPWQEERLVYHRVVHDYHVAHPGKIS